MMELRRLVRYLASPPEDRAGTPPAVELIPRELVQRNYLGPTCYLAGFRQFRGEFASTAVRVGCRETSLNEVVEAFRSETVPVILLKGASYIGCVYSDPAERPMADIDLLVPPAHFERAGRVLRRLGYRAVPKPQVKRTSIHHERAYVRARGTLSIIDLHRSMMQPWRSRIDLAGLWRRARPAVERDDGALRLDPVDELTVHLIHIATHELMVPAVNYVEVARLCQTRQVSESAALDRGRQFRLGRAVQAALAMARALCAGSRRVEWRSPLDRLLPTPSEVLGGRPVPRPLQVLRKALLLEGPRELAGLVAVAAYERV
jgi:hypothetical protein